LPKRRIACRRDSYLPFVERAFPHMASLGFRHTEIPFPAPEEFDAIRDSLSSHGLSATSLHGEIEVGQDDVELQVEAQKPVFEALGCHVLFVSVRLGDTPLDLACERLRRAGQAAAEAGLTIVLETHPELVTNGDVALDTMRRIDHPNVRINFDTANIYFYNEGLAAVSELQKIAPFVAAVHLKDTDGGYRHWHFPALGEGVVDFPGVFAALDAAGFEGVYTLEIEGLDRETKDEQVLCARIEKSVEYLRGIGVQLG